MKTSFHALGLAMLFLCTPLVQAQESSPQVLFENKKDGYRLFRIPAVVTTNSGRIIAFAEGRKSIRDGGNIDLVIKIPDDNGKTWSPTKVIWNDGNKTCGNPAPVVDGESGDVLVVATLNNDKVFVLRSKDKGLTWETPQEITSSVKPADWDWCIRAGTCHTNQKRSCSGANRHTLQPYHSG